jgi:hypothetical protein
MNNEGVAFVLKAFSFLTLGLLTAAIFFIIHFTITSFILKILI